MGVCVLRHVWLDLRVIVWDDDPNCMPNFRIEIMYVVTLSL